VSFLAAIDTRFPTDNYLNFSAFSG